MKLFFFVFYHKSIGLIFNIFHNSLGILSENLTRCDYNLEIIWLVLFDCCQGKQQKIKAMQCAVECIKSMENIRVKSKAQGSLTVNTTSYKIRIQIITKAYYIINQAFLHDYENIHLFKNKYNVYRN